MKTLPFIIVSLLFVLVSVAPASAYYNGCCGYGYPQQAFGYNPGFQGVYNTHALNDINAYQYYTRQNQSAFVYNQPFFQGGTGAVLGNVAYGVTSALLGGVNNGFYYQQPQYFGPSYFGGYQQTTVCTTYYNC